MADTQVLAQIQALIDEEHELRQQEAQGSVSTEQRAKMRALEEHLDQLWDLLRQRRARREFGQNPDEAHLRPVETVEHYQQ